MQDEEEEGRKVKPILIFACGNPSRGDDALGPQLAERLSRQYFATALINPEFELLALPFRTG